LPNDTMPLDVPALARVHLGLSCFRRNMLEIPQPAHSEIARRNRPGAAPPALRPLFPRGD
jgi:hypothetical protein